MNILLSISKGRISHTCWLLQAGRARKEDQECVSLMAASSRVSDTNQVAMKMTKEAKDKAHGEQSSQQTIQDPTKELMNPTRGNGHKPEHQIFFLLVFLKNRICCK